MTAINRREALALPGIAALALAGIRPSRAQQAQQLAIATGTTGGVYYPLGGGMANILSRVIPGMSATVEVTGGSVANLQLLGAKRVGMIITQGDATMDAYKGEDKFKGKPVPVRAIMMLYANRMQVVTTAASGIRSMEDLKGKRISTGAPGSATEVMALRLIEGVGLDKDKDFRARERLSPAESTNAIKDGKLDAYMFVSGIPTSAITDLGATPGVQLVLLDHDRYIPKLTERYGAVYFPDVIPAGTYPGQKSENKQMSTSSIVAVRDDMPDALTSAIVKAIWDGREELGRVHSEGKNIQLENQTNAKVGIPWHPAAEAFWKSQGAKLA